MASATGTSVLGYQTIVSLTTPTIGLFSLFFPDYLTGVPDRVGFLYLFTRPSGASQPFYVVGTRLVYRPGVLLFLPSNLFPSGNTILAGISWNRTGLSWSASLT